MEGKRKIITATRKSGKKDPLPQQKSPEKVRTKSEQKLTNTSKTKLSEKMKTEKMSQLDKIKSKEKIRKSFVENKNILFKF